MIQQCGSCGLLGVVENDGHSCEARDRPAVGHSDGLPTWWRVSTWAALVLTGAYLIVCLARLVAVILDRQLVGRIVDDPYGVSVRDRDILSVGYVHDLANAESTINVLYTLTVFAYILGFVVFFAMSRQLLRRLGDDARVAMRHWSVAAWRIGTLVSVVLAFTGRTPSINVTGHPGWAAAWQSADSERILFAAVRVAVAALLIFAIWVLRKRISALITGRSGSVPALRMQGTRRDGRAIRRRGSTFGMVQGLPRWQAVFVLVPWALGPTAGSLFGGKFGGGFIGAILAGAIGGAIGGGAAMLCSKLARRPGNAGLKAVSLLCVSALAYGGFFGVADLASSALPPVPVSVASPPSAWLSPTGAAPAATQTSVYNPTAPVTPSWMRQAVNLNPPTVLHATGAELHWLAIYNGSYPASGPTDLEVYRGTQTDFTPSPATLIAKLDAKASSFVDTTAPASSGSIPDEYYYMVAVRTKKGDLITGNYQFVALPGFGETEVVVPANGAATLNSAYPDTSNPGLSGVNPDNTGHGATRAIFGFGPLSATPSGAHVSSVHLGVECDGSVPGPLEVYPLTRSFDDGATWNSAATGIAWSHPGGDYAGPAADSLNTAGLCLWDVTSIVHGWTVSPKSEHGLLLRFIDESSSSPYGSFGDGSMNFPGQEPQLLVTYANGS